MSGAFPHGRYPSLQLDLSFLKYESGEVEGEMEVREAEVSGN